jgi:uncharacterized transporter YbjL
VKTFKDSVTVIFYSTILNGAGIACSEDSPGIISQWGGEIFVIQTGLEAHPAYCTIVVGSFSGESGWNLVLIMHLLLVLGYERVGAIPPPPLRACLGISWGDLYL